MTCRRLTQSLLTRLAAARHAGVPWKTLAAELGYADWHTLAGAASRHRELVVRRYRRVNREAVVRLAAAGLTRPAIAKRLGCSRSSVDKACRQLGLTTAGCHSPANRLRGRAVQRDWRTGQRIAAARMGWPQAEWLSEAKILQVLYDAGPIGTSEVTRRVGYQVNTVRYRLRGLMARGLVVRDGRCPRVGEGTAEWRWRLLAERWAAG